MYSRHQKINYKKKSISGRSLLEMMGVLAVVGVITVGAIATFSLAFTEMISKRVLDEARQNAIDLKRRRRVFVDERGEIRYPYRVYEKYISSRTYTDNFSAILLISNAVSPSVCANLETTPSQGIFSSVTCTNTVLTFKIPLDKPLRDPNEEILPDLCIDINCGEYGTCQKGLCVCDTGWTGIYCRTPSCNNVRVEKRCDIEQDEMTNGCVTKQKVNCTTGIQYCGDNGLCATCGTSFTQSCSIGQSQFDEKGCFIVEKISCPTTMSCNSSGECE